MEDTLRVPIESYVPSDNEGLNPCFNGRYSQRRILFPLVVCVKVLILVLMEDTLRV